MMRDVELGYRLFHCMMMLYVEIQRKGVIVLLGFGYKRSLTLRNLFMEIFGALIKGYQALDSSIQLIISRIRRQITRENNESISIHLLNLINLILF